MNKRRLSIFVCILTLLMMLNVLSADEGKTLTLQLEGQKIEGSVLNFEGTNYIPLKTLAMAEGYKVEWVNKDKSIHLSKSGEQIVFKAGDWKLTQNGHEWAMNGELKLIDGKSYVPLNVMMDCFGLKSAIDQKLGLISLRHIKQNPITIAVKQEKSETKSLNIDYQYPQIQGMTNLDAQKKINATFEKLVTDSKAEMKELEDEYGKDVVTRGMKLEAYINYQVKYNENGLLSIVFQDYRFTGGAHGMTIQTGYTFNLSTGNMYSLADLFNKGTNYVAPLSAEIKRQMDETKMTENLLEPFKAIAKDEGYFLYNDAVVIFFQQYEYFPYAAGIQEYSIPFDMMEKELKPEIAKSVQ